VKVSVIGAAQFFVIVGIAVARDDPPPSPVRPWAPPTLPRYEGELRQYEPTEAERRYLPAIDPRKTYNLAELIDIAQRSNPETRVAWERARQAAAAVGVTAECLLSVRCGGCSRGIRPGLHSIPNVAHYATTAANKWQPAQRRDCRRQYFDHRSVAGPRRVNREMVAARLRRTKSDQRSSTGEVDDGECRFQRNAPKNCL